MSDDLVKRGRAGARHEHDDHTVFAEMADRIEELEAALARAEGALWGFGHDAEASYARAALDRTPGGPAAETAPS